MLMKFSQDLRILNSLILITVWCQTINHQLFLFKYPEFVQITLCDQFATVFRLFLPLLCPLFTLKHIPIHEIAVQNGTTKQCILITFHFVLIWAVCWCTLNPLKKKQAQSMCVPVLKWIFECSRLKRRKVEWNVGQSSKPFGNSLVWVKSTHPE